MYYQLVFMPLPALCLSLLFAFIRRQYKIKGLAPEHQGVRLDVVFIAISISVLVTSVGIYAAMTLEFLTVNGLAALIYVTFFFLWIFEMHNVGARLIRFGLTPPNDTTPKQP